MYCKTNYKVILGVDILLLNELVLLFKVQLKFCTHISKIIPDLVYNLIQTGIF